MTTINIHASLIEKCRYGDQEAQREIYNQYAQAMYNCALRICGNKEDAEDVLQEGFLSAFMHIDSYRGEATFGAWLKRIIVNKALNVSRKATDFSDHTYVSDFEETSTYDEERIEYSVEKIRKSVSFLPEGFRTVLCLYLFEGYDHQEISEILGISVSTSKSQYMRAKERMRALLKNE